MLNPPAYARARAAAFHSGLMRRLIVRFKFEDRHEALPFFTRLMGEAGRDLLASAEVIVPVPLHPLRLLQRRYNQSALLARSLARETKKPVAPSVLRRVRRTAPQVGLDRAARASNVDAAFAVNEARRGQIAGKRVLLIDDVLTTGATVAACAHTLKSAGALSVDVLALALAKFADDAPPDYDPIAG
jgi:ComF family protein